MLKKISIFILLFFAFGLLQAHNMIPHQHERKDKAHHHHHGDASHSHGEDTDSDQKLPLGSFSHDATFGQVLIKPSLIKTDFTTDVSDAFITIAPIKTTVVYESPTDIPIPKNIRLFNLPYFSYAVPLRAPPCGFIPIC